MKDKDKFAALKASFVNPCLSYTRLNVIVYKFQNAVAPHLQYPCLTGRHSSKARLENNLTILVMTFNFASLSDEDHLQAAQPHSSSVSLLKLINPKTFPTLSSFKIGPPQLAKAVFARLEQKKSKMKQPWEKLSVPSFIVHKRKFSLLPRPTPILMFSQVVVILGILALVFSLGIGGSRLRRDWSGCW